MFFLIESLRFEYPAEVLSLERVLSDLVNGRINRKKSRVHREADCASSYKEKRKNHATDQRGAVVVSLTIPTALRP